MARKKCIVRSYFVEGYYFLYIIHRFYLFLFATASNNNMRLRKDNANHSLGVMNIIMPPLMQSLTQVKMYKPLVAQMCIALL